MLGNIIECTVTFLHFLSDNIANPFSSIMYKHLDMMCPKISNSEMKTFLILSIYIELLKRLKEKKQIYRQQMH